jgi:hypothetical protein
MVDITDQLLFNFLQVQPFRIVHNHILMPNLLPLSLAHQIVSGVHVLLGYGPEVSGPRLRYLILVAPLGHCHLGRYLPGGELQTFLEVTFTD